MWIMRAKTHAMGIRMNSEQHDELCRIAESMSVEPSFLIRTAVEGLLNYVEANDGKITLPIDFTSAFTDIKKLLDIIEDKNDGHRGQG
jgi:hypothetical protein